MTEQRLQEIEARMDAMTELCGDMASICPDEEDAVLLESIPADMNGLLVHVRTLQADLAQARATVTEYGYDHHSGGDLCRGCRQWRHKGHTEGCYVGRYTNE